MNLDIKSDEVNDKVDEIYTFLKEQGIDVLVDDRKERPGVKFKDADLIGIPMQLVVGGRGLKNGIIEADSRLSTVPGRPGLLGDIIPGGSRALPGTAEILLLLVLFSLWIHPLTGYCAGNGDINIEPDILDVLQDRIPVIKYREFYNTSRADHTPGRRRIDLFLLRGVVSDDDGG